MRGRAYLWAWVAAWAGAVVAAAGCHHDKNNVKVKYPEAFVAPPEEDRYNNPREEGYRKPTGPKKDAAGLGGGGKVGAPGSMSATQFGR